VKIGKDGHPTQFWQKSKQPLMLRKTALKRALVEAFPGLFSGAYSNVEFEEMPEGTGHYDIQVVTLADFEKATPGISHEILNRLQDSLDVYEERLNRKS